MKNNKKSDGPKVLFMDIETAPMLGYVWGLFDQNVGLNQVASDWHLLSWSAKWLGSSEILYADQRNVRDVENDKAILAKMWKLLDEADIVVTQNGDAFDIKKLNARFLVHGFQPPSSYRRIDTKKLAKKNFAFTSNKLEYMTDKFNTKYKKLKHKKFSGFELWKECLAGNLAAWKEMERYNKYDVLSLEELYHKLAPWDSTIDFNVYRESTVTACNCGSTELIRNGFSYKSTGKFQRFTCKKCGAESYDRQNMLSKEKRQSLRGKAVR